MNYQDVKQLVREQLHHSLEEVVDQKKCPKCGFYVTMLKVHVEPSAEVLAEIVTKWRCLNCLGLFTEEFKES